MVGLEEIDKHRIFPFPFKQYRLNRNSKSRDNGLQFLGNTAWVSQIGYDETRQVSKCPHCLGNTPTARFLKVKQNR